MGIFYEKTVWSCSYAAIASVTSAGGYPELAPVMSLCSAAANPTSLGVDTFHYLEMLVTTQEARGQGVATEIVQHIQGKDCLAVTIHSLITGYV